MLPAAVLAPWVAAAVDRHPRRTAIVASGLVRAAAMAMLAAAVAAGAGLPVVLALAAVYMVADSAHKPAQAALLPRAARSPAELVAANAAWSAGDNAAFLLGSLLAGALAALVGIAAGFAVCVVPLAVGALLAVQLPPDARPPEVPGVQPEGVRREVGAGFRTVAADRELSLLLGVYGADMLVQSMIDVLLVVAAIDLLGLGEAGVGWLSAAWGVGGLAGGMAAAELLRRGRLALGLRLGCLLAGLPLCVVGLLHAPGPAVAALLVLGAGFALIEVVLLTSTQRLAADDVLARVYGAQAVVHLTATAGGAVLAAAVVGAAGTVPALLLTGAALPLLALVLGRAFAAFDVPGAAAPERFALVRGLPLFAPLPVAMVETLALRMHPEDFEDGALLIEQGAVGTDFYVLADGDVEVSIDGAVVRSQSPGSFFGEIALLRDVPRTASIRAVGPVRVLRLAREDFLAGIRAHPRSARAADGVVLERLAASTARPPA
jgi:predicted MFS family arabinose efflux permease